MSRTTSFLKDEEVHLENTNQWRICRLNNGCYMNEVTKNTTVKVITSVYIINKFLSIEVKPVKSQR